MKTNFEKKANSIINCDSDTYSEFKEYFKYLRKEDKVMFLDVLNDMLTKKNIELSLNQFSENLPAPLLRKDFKDDDLKYYEERAKIIKEKEEDLLKIKEEIPILINKIGKNIELKNDELVADEGSDRQNNDFLEYLKINTDIISKDDFIKTLYNGLQGTSINVQIEEFKNHFSNSYNGPKLLWRKSERLLVYFITGINEKYLLNEIYLDIILDHFAKSDKNEVKKEFNRTRLSKTFSKLGTLKKMPIGYSHIDRIIESLKRLENK